MTSLTLRNSILALVAAAGLAAGPVVFLLVPGFVGMGAAAGLVLAGVVALLLLCVLPDALRAALAVVARKAGRTVSVASLPLAEWPSMTRAAERSMTVAPAVEVAPVRAAEANADAMLAVLKQACTELHSGNLDYKMAASSGMAGEFAHNYNEITNRIAKLVSDVAALAAEMNLQSGEIARASEDLAKRTETNAHQLEQGSYALAEVDTRLQETAEKARQTAARASAALQDVHKGHQVALDAVAAMQRVEVSAKGIADVIGGLDKIAFQTRVLAMNAAIEASRAGEAGRGFTVVADLVNSLAQRAEEESRSARDQLKATQSDIKEAVGAVQNMDSALSGISAGMTEVDELLQAIADDNRAQSVAITSASGVISAMDSATQQNAATAEQAAAASRQLHDFVETLTSLAGQFKVGGKPAASTATSKAKTASPSQPGASTALAKAPAKPVTAAPPPKAASPAAPPVKASGSGTNVVSLASARSATPQTAPKPAATTAPRAPVKSDSAPVAVSAKPVAAAKPTHAAVSEDDDWQDF